MDKTPLSLEAGKKALLHHVVEKALAIRDKYGNFMDYPILLRILDDRDCVRYPVRLEFNSEAIDPGFFAVAKAVSADNPAEGYVIFLHEHFQKRLDDIPALVFYHLVVINYGDIVTHDEAEVFGATALGIKQEEYYQFLCRLTDAIPQ